MGYGFSNFTMENRVMPLTHPNIHTHRQTHTGNHPRPMSSDTLLKRCFFLKKC